MTVKMIEGPWIAVVASSGPDDPDVRYDIWGDGFKTRDQAETYLRHNHPKAWKARRAFPMEAKAMARPEDKIGEFETVEEAKELMERVATGPKGTETKQ